MRKEVDDIHIFRRQFLDLIATDEDKKHSFYRIVQYTDDSFVHELSMHISEKFADINWDALEKIHRIREESIPKVNIMKLLTVLTLILTASQLGVSFFQLEASLLKIPAGVLQTEEWVLWIVWIVFYFLFLVIVSMLRLRQLRVKRRRIRRAGDVFRYLAIRNRPDALGK